MRTYNVSSETNQSIYAHFPFETAKQTTEEKGLLDSGATHNFIDIRTIIRLGIGTKRLKEPRTVTNVDGTTNRAGSINKYADLHFLHKGKTLTLPVYVTNLGRDRIILGLPWFQEFEPIISWKKGTLEGLMMITTSTQMAEINKTTLATSWAIMNKENKTRL